MTPAEVIPAPNGKFFAVTFIKRSTGKLRRMVARTGVHRHLAGGPPAYNPTTKGLIWVWDVNAPSKRARSILHPRRHLGAYRSIPIEGIVSLRIAGVTYTVSTPLQEAA